MLSQILTSEARERCKSDMNLTLPYVSSTFVLPRENHKKDRVFLFI